jgi:hypothetical protein
MIIFVYYISKRMGQKSSSVKKQFVGGGNGDNTDALQDIDILAADYILSSDPKGLQKLTDPKFCNKVKNAINHAFQTHVHGIDRYYASHRVHHGFNFSDDHLDNINQPSSCEQIAEFYTLLANLYATIVLVVKPNQRMGKKHQYVEICNNVLSAFQQNNLDHLYMDKFNYETNQFDSMSAKGKEEYRKDLDVFYKSVFGTERPKEVTSFADIDFSHVPHETELEETNNSLALYGSHVQSIIKKTTKAQKELVYILDSLFLPIQDQQEFRVHPSLTLLSLKKLLFKARKIITQLFIQCTRDQELSKSLFDKVVTEKTLHTLQNQILSLEEDRANLV